MSNESQLEDEAARRLEYALERIARAATKSAEAAARGQPEPPEVQQLRVRLDNLIARLRAGLAERHN